MSPEVEDIVKRWIAGQSEFSITTSGSTGQPKPFMLQRNNLIWSAQQTLKYFISNPGKQLICLPLNKVGGFMQVIRALVWNYPFYQIDPSSNPLINAEIPADCSIASFTPHQLFHILNIPESRKKLKQFDSILIGGGEISSAMEKELITDLPKVNFIHTFGMTETYSHFAGRKLGQEWYQLTDNIEIKTNEMGCLMINSPLIKNHLESNVVKHALPSNIESTIGNKQINNQNYWLTTQDIIEIHPNGVHFRWLGRADFTINSGGVKIQLETVEKFIREQLKWTETDFFCWGMPHESLGQELTFFYNTTSIHCKLIQLVESTNLENNIPIPTEPTSKENTNSYNELLISDCLSRLPWKNLFEKPRRIEHLSEILFTETQKIKRRESVELWQKTNHQKI